MYLDLYDLSTCLIIVQGTPLVYSNHCILFFYYRVDVVQLGVYEFFIDDADDYMVVRKRDMFGIAYDSDATRFIVSEM